MPGRFYYVRKPERGLNYVSTGVIWVIWLVSSGVLLQLMRKWKKAWECVIISVVGFSD